MIELSVQEVAQLFESLDPYPFREKDLDKDAEEFIVGWARELPGRTFGVDAGASRQERGTQNDGKNFHRLLYPSARGRSQK